MARGITHSRTAIRRRRTGSFRFWARAKASVASSSVVNTLVERNLLEEAGRLDLPGRPVAYRTTDNFLRCFGLSRIEELPPLPNQEGQLDFDELAEMELEKEKGTV